VKKVTEMSERKKNKHEVQVACKFHQPRRLLNVDIVAVEHVSCS